MEQWRVSFIGGCQNWLYKTGELFVTGGDANQKIGGPGNTIVKVKSVEL